MDSSDNAEQFFAQLLNDYFEECDEHLTAVRHNLLQLEDVVGQEQVEPDLLNELFRSFHTLKGISGMAGLKTAEEIAHYMESYLRALRQRQIILTSNGLEALIAGVKTLEQTIAAKRLNDQPPDTALAIAQLNLVTPKSSDNAKNFIVEENTSSEITQTQQLDSVNAEQTPLNHNTYRFLFAPNAELAERGVNVNSVRARLQEIGKLKQSVPRVGEEGKIVFEFTVETNADESTFIEWINDGITYELIDEPTVASITNKTDTQGQSFSESESLPLDQMKTEGGSSAVMGAKSAPSNVVRVDISRLDDIARLMGDLIINRARLEEQIKGVEKSLPPGTWRELQETGMTMERTMRELHEGIMRVRMVPVGGVFERMQFVVRDLTREMNKKIHLELSGQETEIDKFVVERMMDPFLHLVRNAVDHGLETTEERIEQGKSPEGNLLLKASTVGRNVLIEIADDGRGIDRQRIIERARAQGLIGAQTIIDDKTLLDIICTPGFSTRDTADNTSGRGVGMDVVNNTVTELGGTFTLETEAGKGTRFLIQLPLTLAVVPALIVAVGEQKFAVPQAEVREIIEIEPLTIKKLEKNELVPYRGGALPLIRLSRLFHLPETEAGRAFYAFVIGSGKTAVGIGVDRVLNQREVVVRALSDPLVQVNGVTGATELGDGRVVLILDVTALCLKLATNTAAH